MGGHSRSTSTTTSMRSSRVCLRSWAKEHRNGNTSTCTGRKVRRPALESSNASKSPSGRPDPDLETAATTPGIGMAASGATCSGCIDMYADPEDSQGRDVGLYAGPHTGCFPTSCSPGWCACALGPFRQRVLCRGRESLLWSELAPDHERLLAVLCRSVSSPLLRNPYQRAAAEDQRRGAPRGRARRGHAHRALGFQRPPRKSPSTTAR